MNKLVKALVLVLCVVALVGGSVAGTLAWLSMKTEAVTNTFTAGNINITLTQANVLTDAKIVPGATYTVNPKVTVTAKSEKCYLFVKLDGKLGEDTTVTSGNNSLNFQSYLPYTVLTGANEWTALAGETGVYYRVVDVSTASESAEFSILNANTLTADNQRTKADYDALGARSLNLSITAYAVQFNGLTNGVTEAWEIAEDLS